MAHGAKPFRDLLDSWLICLGDSERLEVDFLLHAKGNHGQPCSMVQAVCQLRRFVLESKVVDAAAYSSHSCKTTFPSWATQADVGTETEHAKQGHWKIATSANIGLYGRCDVEPALRLQKKLGNFIIEGFRPRQAQMRGARPPLEEPPVLESLDWSLRSQTAHDDKGEAGEVSSSEDEAASSQPPALPPRLPPDPPSLPVDRRRSREAVAADAASEKKQVRFHDFLERRSSSRSRGRR